MDTAVSHDARSEPPLSTNNNELLAVAAVSYCAPGARKESAATHPTELAGLYL